MTSFVHHLRTQVARHGDDRWYALVDEHKGELVELERVTFAELDGRARSAGAWLAGAGLGGEAALLLYPTGLEFLRVFLGCLYSRVIAVPSPLPSTDPRALERAEGIIKDADIRMVLTDTANAPMLTSWLRESGLDGRVTCVATDAAAMPDPDAWEPPELEPGAPAYLQYTSGSTSEPRGVLLSHGNLLHNSAQIYTILGRPEDGIGAGWLPHYHDMGLIGLLLQPLYAGGSLAFASPVSFVMRPALWPRMISRYRAQYTVAPNFAYEWLVRGVKDEQLTGLDLSSLAWALNGAEPVRTSTLEKVVRRFGEVGFRREAWAPGYGMAEATLLVTGTQRGRGPVVGRFDPAALEQDRAEPAAEGVELVGCGRPIDLTVRIVHPESAESLPDGRIGEIWVAGGSVALGYWQRAETTGETFRARLATGEGPFLRTGDLGFVHDGELYVTGRLKDLIIVNGRNIYPQDVEEASRDVHPAARAAAAFGVEAGREHVVLVQEVRPKDLGDLTYADLARRIKGELARAFGLPSMNVVLVQRGGVGKTTSGKIQRRRMRETFLAGRITPLHAELEPELRALIPTGE
ncbi:fatty acyl-AMP ligase [Actinoallomurus rhizosphaericola]|uniref:fatty acyl-AMP ligase n=1 Tax=Actinoallomurus rhizosphaericola TaxID=2952536 RepID=UPI002093EE81|nr:fatty acyl-AMP ligase [Actinoallomurus rhizosphaericola]MCO5994847.1 fatty acyl-AMP ligase [Actinoallomurus rhizosphaericola]